MIVWVNITGLFSDLQYGFHAFRSTADIPTAFSERIYNPLDAGGETRVIVLDIFKVFNKVWHAGLLQAKSLWCCFAILSILEFYCRNVHWKLFYMTSCSIWPVVLYDQLFYMTSCSIWPVVLYDQLFYMTSCSIWPVVLYDQLFYMTSCSIWPVVLYDQLFYMTSCSIWPVLTSCIINAGVLRDQFCGQHYSWFLLIIFPRFYQE